MSSPRFLLKAVEGVASLVAVAMASRCAPFLSVGPFVSASQFLGIIGESSPFGRGTPGPSHHRRVVANRAEKKWNTGTNGRTDSNGYCSSTRSEERRVGKE